MQTSTGVRPHARGYRWGPNRKAIRAVSVVRAQASSADARTIPVPTTPEQQVNQAVSAVLAAWKDGVSKQRVELLLPLIGATDLDDWPGGIRQQFKAAQPLVESLLRSVKASEGLQGPLAADIWDQGDAVAAWSSEKLACVVFPTAATIDRLGELAERTQQLAMIVNPQWELKGNLVSDFGLGGTRQRREALAASFVDSYYLKQLRVYGDEVRVLRAYPGKFQVHAVSRNGDAPCIATFDSLPSYQDIEALLKSRPGSAMNKSLFDRLKDEWKFNQDSLQNPPQ